MKQELEALEAVFDGKAFQFQQPLNLAIGTRVKLVIEIISTNERTPKSFLKTAQSLQVEGKSDWSEKIDQYLYGETVADND